MTFSIETFSTSLCLGYSTGAGISNPKLASFGQIENPLNICQIISHLFKMHEREIKLVAEEILDDDKYVSFESYMRALLSRCVKLSSTPNYLHFMLVCTLISSTVSKNFQNTKCFTFANVTAQCLVAIYERCYKSFFQTNNESLSCYCRRLRELFVSSEDENKFQFCDKQQISSLILSLNDVDDMKFVLTSSEQKMLDDAMIYASSDSSTTVSSKSSVDDDNDVMSGDSGNASEEEEGDLNISCENKICGYCGGKCIELFLSYEAEVNKK